MARGGRDGRNWLRRWHGLAVGLLVAVCLAASGSPTAHAHAELVRSQPGNGEQVAEPPAKVVLSYSEGVQLGEITVIDAHGQRVDRGELTIGPEDRTIVEVPLQEIGNGIYTVTWQVLADDGHVTKGSFFFIVGEELPSRERFLELLARDAGSGGQISPLEPPVRGLLFLALATLVGAPAILLLIVRPAARATGLGEDHLWPGARWLLLAAAALLAGASTLLAASQALAAYPALSAEHAWAFVATTDQGKVALARIGLGLGFGAVLLLAPWRLAWLLGGVATGLAAQASVSWLSHTATLAKGGLAVLADLGHLLGGGLWAGGLVVLAVLVPSVLPGQDAAKAAAFAARVVRRFSTLAIAGVALVVATGLLLASFHVPDGGTLLTTLYGAALSGKVGLVLLALALGAWHRLVVSRRLATLALASGEGSRGAGALRRFTRSVRLETLVVLGVFGLSGLLTSVPPATVAVAQGAGQGPLTLADRIQEVDLDLTIAPARLGLNLFEVAFSRNGEPVSELEDVVVLLRLPETELQLPQLALTPVEPGRYSTFGSFTLPGKWRVRVAAMVAGQYTTKTFQVEVVDPTQDTTTPGDEAFQRLLRLAAGVVGLLGGGALVYEFVGHRREWRAG